MKFTNGCTCGPQLGLALHIRETYGTRVHPGAGRRGEGSTPHSLVEGAQLFGRSRLGHTDSSVARVRRRLVAREKSPSTQIDLWGRVAG